MSRWGDGNFEADFANDYLTDVVYNILDSIHKCLGEIIENDICGDASLMPAVDILVTLGTAYPHVVVPMLEDENIDDWRTKYLSIFDSRNDKVDRSGRRTVVVQTFTNLENLVESNK